MSKNIKRRNFKPLYSGSEVKNSCKSGKVTYRTEAAANFAITRILSSVNGDERRKEKRVYKCHLCNYYHMTSMSKQHFNSFQESHVTNTNKRIKTLPTENENDILTFPKLSHILDEVCEKFSSDPKLSITVYSAVSEFKTYYFNSTSETLKVIDMIMNELKGEVWQNYKTEAFHS